MQSRFATPCHVPWLYLARHSFPPPLSPSRVAGSLLPDAEEQGTLFQACDPASRPALMERFAVSVETNFATNCSGYRWGHLGVCIVCGNCFISAGKENTYYHVFAADGGFCVGTLSHQRKREERVTHTSGFQNCSLLPTLPPLWPGGGPARQGGVPRGHCMRPLSSRRQPD